MMMRGVLPSLEKHHNVRILDERVWTRPCVSRIATSPDRQLPDKAVSVLDTACARARARPDRDAAGARGRDAPPRRSRGAEARARARSAVGADHTERLAEIESRPREDRCRAQGADRALRAGEGDSSREIREIRRKLEAHHAGANSNTTTPTRSRDERLTTLNERSEHAPGRDAAHARHASTRRSSAKCVSALDRHSRRQDDEGRDGDDAQAREARWARASSARITALEQISQRIRTSKAGHRGSAEADRRVHARRAVAASARRRRRSRSPTCSTAASRT